jgi:SSS family transporter
MFRFSPKVLLIGFAGPMLAQAGESSYSQAGTMEYITVVSYMALLVVVGFFFSRLNRSSDDFLRGGGRASWWMVGMSSFMSGFSAWTFTGGAGAVFEAGWSVMWIFWSQVAGYLVAAIWLAPWFRQLRVTAAGELTQIRYTEHLAQFSTWITLPLSPVYPAIQLFGLGIFCSAVFGFPIEWTILSLGIAILLYSVSGGLWGVMATDFLQGVVLLPFTVLVAVLALNEIGGVSGFLEHISDPSVRESFAIIKPEGSYEGGKYTAFWALAIFLQSFTGYLGMGNALRYRACVDGRGARKAALFAGTLQFIGPVIWFIPPMVALFLYPDQVNAVDLGKPGEASYAVTALNVLPAGLVGIMVVGMFSATMSSMDTGLSNGSANIIKIIYPGLCRLFRKEPSEDPRFLLMMSRVLTLTVGGIIICFAILLSRKGGGVFDVMLKVGAFTAGLGIPYLWGMFFKRVPSWCPYLSMTIGFIPAFLGLYSEQLFGESWNFQTRFFATFMTGNLCFFGTMPFWKYASPAYKAKVDTFFTRMKTPVNVAEETGDLTESDRLQLQIMGYATLAVGVFIFVIGLIPTALSERLISWAFAASIAMIGVGMLLYQYRSSHRN